jgi:hypothetical protein
MDDRRHVRGGDRRHPAENNKSAPMYRNWRMNLRLVAGVCSALVAIGGFAAAYSDYLPATRGYAKDVAKSQTDSAFQVMSSLQREGNETRLQVNQIRREGLRNAKWSWSEQLKTAPDAQARQNIQQRLDEIDDGLRDVEAERDRLRIPSP